MTAQASPDLPSGTHLSSVPDATVAGRPEGVWWAWRPLHGGSGVSTLARALPLAAELGDDPRLDALPQVAVVRSHAAGLGTATDWAAQIGTTVPTRSVLGLVIVHDAPGRLPRELESMIRLASSGYPATWRIPWVPEWRLGEAPTASNLPAPCRQLLRDLAAAAGVPLTNTIPGGTR